MRRFGRFLVIFILILVAAEAGMRLTGFFLQLPSHQRNAIHPEDRNKLRVLALGESTTADYFLDESDGAWPRQLEAALNKGGYPARVYNEGLAGTTTALIASR